MLLFIDTETGGLDPTRHSLLEVCIWIYNEETGMLGASLDRKIKHKEYVVEGRAMQINKISIVDCELSGVTPQEYVEELKLFLNYHNILEKKPVLAGHNVSFDRNFLKYFLASIGESIDDYLDYHTLDTASVIGFLKVTGLLKPDFPNNLGKAARALGIEVEEKAEHTGWYDALLSMNVLKKLMDIAKGREKV